MLSVSVLAVLTIIFGDKLENANGLIRRYLTNQSRSLTGWSVVVDTLTAREAVIPAFVISGLLSFGFVLPLDLGQAVADKIEIVYLILTFSVIAYGIKQSGYFRYAAFRVLEVCDENMTRMILYLFLLTSVLTYVTSNDIVILVMTPIVLELCRQSHIRNARLLLLGQFVAANTLSMGLLIGSPTNIIVSLNAGINFADYFLLMLVPSVLAIGISFLVLQFINMHFYKWIATFTNLDWGHESHYTMPALSVQPNFTSEMRNWVLFFILVIIAVAVVSHFQWSFFWVTIPTMAFGLVGVHGSSGGVDNVSEASQAAGNIGSTDRRKLAVMDRLASLPYSIIAFALVFFAIADVLAREVSLSAILEGIIRLPVFFNAVVSMFGTAALVNTVNDLPASAIIGEAVGSYPGEHSLRYTVFLQSSLAPIHRQDKCRGVLKG